MSAGVVCDQVRRAGIHHSDRTTCTKATANQLRLFLHAGAYWLMWGLRASMPKRSMWRVAQFDTLRLRFAKSPFASSK